MESRVESGAGGVQSGGDETSRVAQRFTTRVAGNPHGLSEPCSYPGSEQPLKAYGSCATLSFPGVFFAWKLWRLVFK